MSEETSPNPAVAADIPAELVSLRASIDNLDAAVIHIMAERFKITQRVGQLKAQLNMPPADPKREEQQIARLRQLAKESQLDPQFAAELLAFIVSKVVRNHEQIRNDSVSQ